MKEILPEIWKNRSKIIEGIKNLSFKKEHIEELARHRKEICKSCIWFNKNQTTKPFEEIPELIRKLKSKEWILDVTNSESEKCIHCGCSLGEKSLKLRCTSCDCPILKWKAVSSVEEQDKIQKIIENEQ